MEDLLVLIEQTKEKFNVMNNQININDGRIQAIQEETTAYKQEQFRLQGEYRLLTQMAKEEGLIDDDGNIVEHEAKAEPNNEAVPKAIQA
jgi:hypothetical protein